MEPGFSLLSRENLNNRKGQRDCTPVGSYHFTWTAKGVRFYPNYLIIAGLREAAKKVIFSANTGLIVNKYLVESWTR